MKEESEIPEYFLKKNIQDVSELGNGKINLIT